MGSTLRAYQENEVASYAGHPFIPWGPMKEYKLSAWPELPASFHRTSYRRMLSDMSHRFVSVQQLMASSGASRLEARTFVQMLADRGLLTEREAEGTAFLRLGHWLRRALQGDAVELHER